MASKAGRYLAVAGLMLTGVITLWWLASQAVEGDSTEVYFARGGSATSDKIRTPFTSKAQVRQLPVRGGRNTIHFSCRLTDATGKEIARLRLGGRMAKPPKVEVYNSDGKRAYTGTMEYG